MLQSGLISLHRNWVMLHVKTCVVQELGNVAQEHSGVVLGLGNLVQDWGSTGLSTYFWMIACSY